MFAYHVCKETLLWIIHPHNGTFKKKVKENILEHKFTIIEAMQKECKKIQVSNADAFFSRTETIILQN
jgi:hypothetical protein